jgi:hypothetical protein
MKTLAELGIAPTLLSIIMAQASIVLIACSIVLTLLRDFYEDDKQVAADAPARPLLVSTGAERIRDFLRTFLYIISLFYTALGLAILLVEFWPDNVKDAFEFKSRMIDITFRFDLQGVYSVASYGHFAIVLVIGLLVAWAARVRDQEARTRWAGHARRST